MTPAEFLETVVKPNRAELDANYRSVRLAFNCVAAVDALAAHLFWWREKSGCPSGCANDSAYRQTLAGRSPQFAIIRDIAKAQKHVELRQGRPTLTSASQVGVSGVGYGEGAFGRGRFGGVAQVLVQLNDGTWDYVESLLDECIDFLENEMQIAGALA